MQAIEHISDIRAWLARDPAAAYHSQKKPVGWSDWPNG